MKCFECNENAEVKKYKAYPYEGINLNDVHLFNIEVMHCAKCRAEIPLIPQPSRLLSTIGLAVVTQPARLSNADAKFLRRNAGFTLKDWAGRIGIAEATYSKMENSRSISPQNDRLIRVNYLNVLKQKFGERFMLARYLEKVLEVDTGQKKEFAIAIDAGDLEKEARYLSYNSPLLSKPESSFIAAPTLRTERLAPIRLVGRATGRKVSFHQEIAGCGL